MVPIESRAATVHNSTIGAAQLLTTLPRPLKLQLRKVIELASILTVDLGALGISVALAYFARVFILPWLSGAFPPGLPPNLPERLWWLPAVFIGSIVYESLYTRRYSFWRECGLLIKAATLAFLVSLSIVTLAKTGGEVSRTLVVLIWFFSLVMLPAFRYTGKNLLARAGIWEKKVLVLGAGRTGELVMQALDREPYMGYRVVGLLDDDPEKKYRIFTVNGGARVKVLGGFRDSDNVMAETGVYNVIVAAPGLAGNVLVGLVNRLQRVCDSVIVVPDLFGLPVMGVEASYFFDDRFLALRLKNNLASRTNIFLKRAFDLTAGAVVLLLLLPVMAAIALAVKLDSPGPAVFAHRRIGRGGREFMCYKFRTMFLNNEEIFKEYLKDTPGAKEEWEKYAKIKGRDPRVTRIGNVLRKLSLDELPQIFNVLSGQMSLVGPRPYLPRERQRMNNYANTILLTYPGMTGLWQVSGRNEIDFEDRLRIDNWYVRNWSLWLDITLLLRTVAVVLDRRGAY